MINLENVRLDLWQNPRFFQFAFQYPKPSWPIVRFILSMVTTSITSFQVLGPSIESGSLLFSKY